MKFIWFSLLISAFIYFVIAPYFSLQNDKIMKHNVIAAKYTGKVCDYAGNKVFVKKLVREASLTYGGAVVVQYGTGNIKEFMVKHIHLTNCKDL